MLSFQTRIHLLFFCRSYIVDVPLLLPVISLADASFKDHYSQKVSLWKRLLAESKISFSFDVDDVTHITAPSLDS